MPRTTRFPDVPNQVHVATVHYDFALDAGAEGEIVLPGIFPSGALFFNGICHVLETLAGVGTSIGLNLGGVAIIAAEAVAGWDAGLKVTDVLTVTDGEGNYNPMILDGDGNLSIEIAGGDLTAGKIAIHMFYIMSPAEPIQLMALSAPEEEESPEPPPPEDEPAVEEAAVEEQPQRRSHHRKKNEDEE